MNIPHEPHEHPTSPNDPNGGLNIKTYLTVVAVAAIVIVLALWITVYNTRGSKATPAPSQIVAPGSSLFESPVFRVKPSPLHPVGLQATIKPTRRIHVNSASGEPGSGN